MNRAPRMVALAGTAAAALIPLTTAYAAAGSLAGVTQTVTVKATRTVAQVFTASQSGNLSAVTVPLQGPDQSDVTVAVESVTNGVPTGTVLGGSPLVLSGLANAMKYVSIPISGVSLTAGTPYALVMAETAGSASWGATNEATLPAALTENPRAANLTWSALAGTNMAFTVTVAPTTVTVPVDTDLTGSTLGFQSVASPALPDVQLTGIDQTTSPVPMPIAVNDARGTGAGWQVSLQTTPFRSTNGHQLPTDTLQIATPATATCSAAATGCVPARGSATTFKSTTGQPQPLFVAAPGTGMGSQTIAPTVQLRIPAGAYAGSYTSDWTVSISTGP